MRNYTGKIGALLRLHLERAGSNRTQLAQAMSVTLTTIGRWLDGKKPPPIKRLEEMIEILRIDDEDAEALRTLNFRARVNPEGLELERRALRFSGKRKQTAESVAAGDLFVRCGGRAAADDSGRTIVDFDHTGESLKISKGIAYVEVVGSSMEPIALDGQKVFVDDMSRSAKAGDLVVVETVDGETYLKRFFEDGKDVLLTSCNPLNHQRPIRLLSAEIRTLRVVIGVWFGE